MCVGRKIFVVVVQWQVFVVVVTFKRLVFYSEEGGILEAGIAISMSLVSKTYDIKVSGFECFIVLPCASLVLVSFIIRHSGKLKSYLFLGNKMIWNHLLLDFWYQADSLESDGAITLPELLENKDIGTGWL